MVRLSDKKNFFCYQNELFEYLDILIDFLNKNKNMIIELWQNVTKPAFPAIQNESDRFSRKETQFDTVRTKRVGRKGSTLNFHEE